ncbi:unnamed protein product, partial [Allacma fusca]
MPENGPTYATFDLVEQLSNSDDAGCRTGSAQTSSLKSSAAPGIPSTSDNSTIRRDLAVPSQPSIVPDNADTTETSSGIHDQTYPDIFEQSADETVLTNVSDSSPGNAAGGRRIIPLTPEALAPIAPYPGCSGSSIPSSSTSKQVREVVVSTPKGNFLAQIPEEATHAELKIPKELQGKWFIPKILPTRTRSKTTDASDTLPRRLAVLAIQEPATFTAGQTRSSVPVVWRKSSYPVTIGHYEVNLKVTLLNPCDIISNNSVHHDMEHAIRDQCQHLFQELYLDELNVMCPPQKWTTEAAFRYR